MTLAAYRCVPRTNRYGAHTYTHTLCLIVSVTLRQPYGGALAFVVRGSARLGLGPWFRGPNVPAFRNLVSDRRLFECDVGYESARRKSNAPRALPSGQMNDHRGLGLGHHAKEPPKSSIFSALKPLASALCSRKTSCNVLGNIQVRVQVRRGVVGLQGLGNAQAQRLRDQRPAWDIVPIHEGYSCA